MFVIDTDVLSIVQRGGTIDNDSKPMPHGLAANLKRARDPAEIERHAFIEPAAQPARKLRRALSERFRRRSGERDNKPFT